MRYVKMGKNQLRYIRRTINTYCSSRVTFDIIYAGIVCLYAIIEILINVHINEMVLDRIIGYCSEKF